MDCWVYVSPVCGLEARLMGCWSGCLSCAFRTRLPWWSPIPSVCNHRQADLQRHCTSICKPTVPSPHHHIKSFIGGGPRPRKQFCPSSHGTRPDRRPRPTKHIFLNMMETDSAKPWYSAYPSPRNATPEHITRVDLLERMQRGQRPGVDFLLVDLRKNDHEVRLDC